MSGLKRTFDRRLDAGNRGIHITNELNAEKFAQRIRVEARQRRLAAKSLGEAVARDSIEKLTRNDDEPIEVDGDARQSFGVSELTETCEVTVGFFLYCVDDRIVHGRVRELAPESAASRPMFPKKAEAYVGRDRGDRRRSLRRMGPRVERPARDPAAVREPSAPHTNPGSH